MVYFSIDQDIEAITDIVRKDIPGITEDEVAAFIDSDWPNADEHQEWLDTATIQEIAKWVTSALINTREPKVDYYEKMSGPNGLMYVAVVEDGVCVSAYNWKPGGWFDFTGGEDVVDMLAEELQADGYRRNNARYME